MQDLKVYIDIDLEKLPCELVDMRFVARKGREHSITREHLTKDGIKPMTEDRSVREVLEALDRKEGCKLKGTFFKHFVLNTFIITPGNPAILPFVLMERSTRVLDLSHKINDFMLGDFSNKDYYERYDAVIRTYKLDGFNKLKGSHAMDNRPKNDQDRVYKHTYFISAIPTVFDNMFSSTEIFQYTASEYSKAGEEAAIVFM